MFQIPYTSRVVELWMLSTLMGGVN